MTSGVHLILYDALHLTERSQAYDSSKNAQGQVRGLLATNETHDIDRQLLRMMLALPDLVDSRGKANFPHVS
jgi:hypothetical protein